MIEKVGFVGLGQMGREMVVHVAKAGFQVRAFDLRPEALAGLAEVGVAAAASVADAACGADAVVTVLPDTPQVQEVVLGEGGLAERLGRGAVVVDMSTISASATRDLAQRLGQKGIDMIDAPVSGGDVGARNATLSIMAGGPQEVFERVKPLLAAMGTTLSHIGESGAGQAAKSCNQLIVAVNIQGICEALALGRRAGIDPETLRCALAGGSAGSWMLDNLAPKMVAKDAGAGFRIDLMLKDLRLAGELAHEFGLPLPAASLATNMYLGARAHGEGGNGNQAMFRVYDRLTGQEEGGE